MRRIAHIVIHCSATRAVQTDINIDEITAWHTRPRPRGNGWKTVAYHHIVRRDGIVEDGIPHGTIGNGVAGWNAAAIHVCWVGGIAARADAKGRWQPEDNRTKEQIAALTLLIRRLSAQYPAAIICGHRDFPGVAKACPSFDAIAWAKALGLPASKPKGR